MYYDQMGNPHPTSTLAVLANVWDYDPSALYDLADLDEQPQETHGETAAEWLERFKHDRGLSQECYAPGHLCEECSPF